MRNLDEQQSSKAVTLKVAILVLVVMLFPVEQAQAQSPPRVRRVGTFPALIQTRC